MSRRSAPVWPRGPAIERARTTLRASAEAIAPATAPTTHHSIVAARASSVLAWPSACPIRIAVSSLRILRAFSNLTAPSPMERSMASRRAEGVSSDRTRTVSREACSHSRTAALKAGHSCRSASVAGIAVYSRQRSSTCVSSAAWTLTCCFASGVAMLMNISVRSATSACCMSRSVCKISFAAGRLWVATTWKAALTRENAQMPRPPANPVVRARPTHVAITLARIESACRSFIIPSSHAGASLLRLPLELRQADPDHQRTGRLTVHQHRDRDLDLIGLRRLVELRTALPRAAARERDVELGHPLVDVRGRLLRERDLFALRGAQERLGDQAPAGLHLGA